MAFRSSSLAVVAIVCPLHLLAFALIVAAEKRRSAGKVVPDIYDEQTYCVYNSDVATEYAIFALFLICISQAIVMGITRCLCCGKGLKEESSRTSSVIFFIFSWHGEDFNEWFGIGFRLTFAALGSCLVAGAARNAYHTKYRGDFALGNLSCQSLRKGVFVSAAVLTVANALWTVLYYRSYVRSDSEGWKPYRSETDGGEVNMGNYGQP